MGRGQAGTKRLRADVNTHKLVKLVDDFLKVHPGQCTHGEPLGRMNSSRLTVTVTPLKVIVRQLDADLGGTKMERALTATLAIAMSPATCCSSPTTRFTTSPAWGRAGGKSRSRLSAAIQSPIG